MCNSEVWAFVLEFENNNYTCKSFIKFTPGLCFWFVEANVSSSTTNPKHHPDLGSDASLVWNFWARFIRGAPLPRPTPYPFLYYFWLKRFLFRIPSIDKWYTFHVHSLKLYIPFNTSCICTVFEIWINHETGTFYRLFYSQKMLFTDRKTDFSTFHIRQLVELLSFHTDLTPEKGTPFGRCLLVQPIIRSVPLVLGQ